jgi:Sulfotransferase family
LAHPVIDADGAQGGYRSDEEEQFVEELRQARAVGSRVPDFFVVGHAKCGTTAMHQMLMQHPQIYVPMLKEPEFLARAPFERDALAVGGPEMQRKPALARPQTVAAYLDLFVAAGDAQRAGELSPQYIRVPSAANRIAALNPEARIVALFREPVSFLRSFHLQLLEAGIETERDFATALALEGERRHGRRIPPGCIDPDRLLYSDHVRYVEQLTRYREHFGPGHVLALIYDDFRADNEGTVRQILRFLGVDDTLEIQTIEANPTVDDVSMRARALLNDAAIGKGAGLGALKRALKLIVPGNVRRRALRGARRAAAHKPRPADQDLTSELRRRFEGEVAAASDYLQRDLVGQWGYDR